MPIEITAPQTLNVICLRFNKMILQKVGYAIFYFNTLLHEFYQHQINNDHWLILLKHALK